MGDTRGCIWACDVKKKEMNVQSFGEEKIVVGFVKENRLNEIVTMCDYQYQNVDGKDESCLSYFHWLRSS